MFDNANSVPVFPASAAMSSDLLSTELAATGTNATLAGGRIVPARRALREETIRSNRVICCSSRTCRAEKEECRRGRMKVDQNKPSIADEPSKSERTYERRFKSDSTPRRVEGGWKGVGRGGALLWRGNWAG